MNMSNHNQPNFVLEKKDSENKMSEDIVFPCDICKEDIVIGSNSTGVKIVSKQTTSDDFFGMLDTYHVEAACTSNEIHVNIVVIDGSKRYRGHKYSAVKTAEPDYKVKGSNIRLVLGLKKDLSKVLAAILKGKSIVIAGDSPTTNLWASTLYELFTISSFTIRKWVISYEHFTREYADTSICQFGEFILIDTDLIKEAKKQFPDLLILDTNRNKIVTKADDTDYTKELVNKILKVPSDQNDTLLNFVTIQIEWLRRLLNELRAELDGSIVETAACPIGNLAETVKINSVLDQVLTEKVLGNLRARMRDEEFEIAVSHLLRDVPELEELVNKH